MLEWPAVAVAAGRRRQFDQPRAVQPQQPHPTAHQLRLPQGIGPIQCPAHPPGDLRTNRRIGQVDLQADRFDIRRAQRPSAQLLRYLFAHCLSPSHVRDGDDLISFSILCPARGIYLSQDVVNDVGYRPL